MEDEKEKSDAYERHRERESERSCERCKRDQSCQTLAHLLALPSLQRLSVRFACLAKPGFLSSTQGERGLWAMCLKHLNLGPPQRD